MAAPPNPAKPKVQVRLKIKSSSGPVAGTKPESRIDGSTEVQGNVASTAPKSSRIVLKRKAADEAKTDAETVKNKKAKNQSSEQPVADPDMSATSNNSSSEALVNIVKVLSTFPVGEIAYGAEIPHMPRPKLEILKYGIVEYPYSKVQLGAAKECAEDFRSRKFGIDWKAAQRTPTWYVLRFNNRPCLCMSHCDLTDISDPLGPCPEAPSK